MDGATSTSAEAKEKTTNSSARRNGRNAETEQTEVIDYKMVTFSLGGKDYGIDIMKVKEIAKYSHFTYVPNCPPFVRGVYNLRGEIISVIDLRRMFNLPVENEFNKGTENGLILRLDNNLIGIIVDSIDKVVGISRASIQPPHPIFADINIKYISGVVEHDKRLYIILDVERVFSRETERPTSSVEFPEGTAESLAYSAGAAASSAGRSEVRDGSAASEEDVTLGFVSETLATFASFHVSDINRAWVEKRFAEWHAERGKKKENVQLTSTEDAQAYLSDFFSPFSDSFWSEEYAAKIAEFLPKDVGTSLNIWNPGCGKGYETYSLTCMIRKLYPKIRLKVWASDKDLLNISTAPNLVFPREKVPKLWWNFTVAGKNGHSFSQEIKDLILFEYHDALHPNALPDADLVVARDLLSFIRPEDQQEVLDDFYEHLKDDAVLILGMNERPLETSRWKPVGDTSISAYTKI